jgi:hypothetical protein
LIRAKQQIKRKNKLNEKASAKIKFQMTLIPVASAVSSQIVFKD